MMKKLIFSLFSVILLVSCAPGAKVIQVTNSTSFDRNGEMVEVPVKDLKLCFHGKTYVLTNEQNEEVAYQLINDGGKEPKSLIFLADVKANSTSIYTLAKGTPSEVASKTSARFVPERKDDFAWENDLAAYRMYGPALAKENPSNGVDLWLKRTTELVVDSFYYNELNKGMSYHVDHGKGLDLYKVGHTLGCGGISPFVNDSLYVGKYYNSFEVLENGPLRSTFTLSYDAINAGKNTYKQTITISTVAGGLLNKAVVRLEGDAQDMKLAGGIFLHDGSGILSKDEANGWIAYAENAISDAQVPSGRNYVAVLIPSAIDVKQDNVHALAMADYKVGEEFTYYFGGGWSKWGFETDQDWVDAVAKFANSIQNPLSISVK